MEMKRKIRISESQLRKIVKESVKRILNEGIDGIGKDIEMRPVSPHFGYTEERDIVSRLEDMGWVPQLWNHLNPRLFNKNGSYIIRVGFFDYTYCVGFRDFSMGSLENCRDIIQDIIQKGKTENIEFVDAVEDALIEFEGYDEETGDNEQNIDSVGFDIIAPDGINEVGDARGQHSLMFVYGG